MILSILLVTVLENYLVVPDYYICILNETTKIYECEENAYTTKYDECIAVHNILLCEIKGIEI